MKRQRWHETELLSLPLAEADNLERKSGLLLNDKNNFNNVMAKAISAMANSGGGSIILGAEDNGTLAGVSPFVGHEPIKDWLEQKLPNLVDYPLSDFRVHDVERAENSTIPVDKTVIVIDISDSTLAPHQSKLDRIYYHRSAGRSKPAPHFYIELLRLRVSHAVLSLTLESVEIIAMKRNGSGVFVHLKLSFMLKNVGHSTAYKWDLRAKELDNDKLDSQLLQSVYLFDKTQFPLDTSSYGGIPLDISILPGCERIETRDLGMQLKVVSPNAGHIRSAIDTIVLPTKIGYQLATENSPGDIKFFEPGSHIDLNAFAKDVEKSLLA